MKKMILIDVTAENVAEAGIYCIKDKRAAGHKSKVAWFQDKCNQGLRIKLAVDSSGTQLGFIEYTLAESAWRPVAAPGYYFVHCIAIFGKEARGHHVGSALLQACETEARGRGKLGVCAMTSHGPWMANRMLFEKNAYIQVDQRGRYELMAKPFSKTTARPRLNDWEKHQSKFKGWNLIYADQCPWHQKSVEALKAAAAQRGIALKIKKLTTPEEAQAAPSGFGVFSLIRDGRLIEDHYLSRTRFESILKRELEE